jgi:hypothetical protein
MCASVATIKVFLWHGSIPGLAGRSFMSSSCLQALTPSLLYSQKWSTEEFFRESETNMRQGQDLV